jgi:hypothetical protein
MRRVVYSHYTEAADEAALISSAFRAEAALVTAVPV